MAKKFIYISFLLLLVSCGPREIGQGMASEASLSGGEGARGADLMRYPITGANNTQKMLYYTNKPEVMEQVQNWRTSMLRQRLGIAPSPEDPAYREKPHQKSPFRQ